MPRNTYTDMESNDVFPLGEAKLIYLYRVDKHISLSSVAKRY